jgi:hypothetical protein
MSQSATKNYPGLSSFEGANLAQSGTFSSSKPLQSYQPYQSQISRTSGVQNQPSSLGVSGFSNIQQQPNIRNFGVEESQNIKSGISNFGGV